MTNCLVKLQAFNLRKHFPTLRTSTHGGPWHWVPDFIKQILILHHESKINYDKKKSVKTKKLKEKK